MKFKKAIDLSKLSFETKRDINFFIKEKFQDSTEFTQSQISKIEDIAKSLEEGYPRDYLIGNSEFYGRKYFVDQRVLIPRPETEVLIDILKSLNLADGSILCDLGTGSGCIGISLAMLNENFIVFGTDISEDAIRVARKNNLTYKKKNFFLIQSNWASCFQKDSIDCIISNPPYLDKDDYHLADLKYEPISALVSNLYGLEAFEIISQQAKQLLKKGGYLIFEHGFDQSEDVEKIIYKNDLKLIRKIKDLSGNDRAILVQK